MTHAKRIGKPCIGDQVPANTLLYVSRCGFEVSRCGATVIPNTALPRWVALSVSGAGICARSAQGNPNPPQTI